MDIYEITIILIKQSIILIESIADILIAMNAVNVQT